MKFDDILNEDLSPKWEVIWEIPEFKACIDVPQNTDWHKEKVHEHIKNVTDVMWEFVCGNQPLDPRHDKKALMLSAICHDLGKATNTKWDEKEQQWKCSFHGKAGDRITRKLFWEEPDIELREKVCWMVRYHMDFHYITDAGMVNNNKLTNLLTGRANIGEMGLLYYCDCMGSVNDKQSEADVLKVLDKVSKTTFPRFNDKEMMNFFYYGERRDLEAKTKPIIYVMCGIPGSGKSTFFDNYLKDNAVPVSRDIIREQLGMTKDNIKFKGNKQQEEEVTRVFNREVGRLLKEGKNIVLDNMNTRKKYRDEYHKKWMKYNPGWVYICCEAPTFEESVNRRDGQIPREEMEKIFDNYDYPEPHEYDKVIYHRSND